MAIVHMPSYGIRSPAWSCLEAREGSARGAQVLCLGNVRAKVQKRSGRDGPDTRHGLKEPVLAHHPMRRERLKVCNNAAGSSAPAQRCAGSRARMSDQKAASAGAQHVHQESVAKKGVVSESKVERREDGGGAEPQERRSTSSQRAPSCPPHPAAWF